MCKLEPVFPQKTGNYVGSLAANLVEPDWQKYVRLLIMPIYERNKLDCKYVTGLQDKIYQLNVSAGTKVAFQKYLYANKKEEIQHYRKIALYGFFYSDRAFSLSRQYEREYSVWFQHMCETLIPDIKGFEDIEQCRIIANLAMENAEMQKSTETNRLVEILMRNM